MRLVVALFVHYKCFIRIYTTLGSELITWKSYKGEVGGERVWLCLRKRSGGSPGRLLGERGI